MMLSRFIHNAFVECVYGLFLPKTPAHTIPDRAVLKIRTFGRSLLRIRTTLYRAWRLLGTAISFGAFGLGGLIVGLVLSPALYLFIWDRGRRKKLARATIQRLFRAFVSVMAGVGVLEWRVLGLENYDCSEASLIIANHPSLIDVVFLLAFFPRTTCIVKSRLFRNPSMAPLLRAAEFIPNSSPLETLQRSIDGISAGDSLIMFPEGTRTRPGQVIKFRPGAAAIALRTRCPVIPVLISCDPTTLTKGEPWYHIPSQRVQITLDIQPPIHPVAFVRDSANKRDATAALTHCLEEYFRTKLDVFQANQ